MNDSSDSGSTAARWWFVFSTTVRLIFFRISQVELTQLTWQHLAVGLTCTWLVGMGRYWDNPRVGLLQRLGIGSLVYVFILSLFLWLLIWPLRPRHWAYFRVLTFVSLVSPPAALYAIPVEKFVSLNAANTINAWFLAIVATWRVALLIFFLRRLAALNWIPVITATLLPLTLIVVALVELNLEKVVMNLMGGIQSPSPNDAAYGVLWMLSLLAFLLFLPLVICYLVLVVKYQAIDRFKKRSQVNL